MMVHPTNKRPQHSNHPFAQTLAFLIAAAASYPVSQWIQSRDHTRELLDTQTGVKVTLRRGDSLFLIPVKYWSYVYVAIGILILVRS